MEALQVRSDVNPRREEDDEEEAILPPMDSWLPDSVSGMVTICVKGYYAHAGAV